MRRHDIDSIRVIAFGLLIIYHVGMFFIPWDYHIKNSETYEGLTFPMLFLNQWRLSLLFVVSGMGTYYALNKRTRGQFAKERLRRLFIPFIVGVLFIVPPQIYFERLAKGQFHGSYFEFWPAEAFIGIYPEGNMSWHHLWFIFYLLIFSLIPIPVFVYLHKHTRAWIIRKMESLCSNPFGLYILIIPLFLWRLFLALYFPQTNALVNDWYNLVNYCTLFFFGFLLMTLKDTFWKSVTANKHIYLISGIIAFPILIYLWFGVGSFTGKREISALLRVFNAWSWILAIIGYSAAYLNRPSKKLTYANEAVYPFYILHQTVLIALGYYLMNVDMGFFPKFLIMVTGTFGICWIIYEFGIRRYAWIRPLFGLKPKTKDLH
ncbi:acyltransferase family protein [Prevotella sp. 10(H)]|uniref:acyltransferase family protein n=1 Tax=Prevotella sp. 10(H) TaxID=1158294 RepID=UPI0004A74F79|nr:acyltransferase family protein [Prevotella sp. 10(H)]